jgi:pSer/pThr/pTyr-binding forkhead associated (FHA) protein
MQFEVKQGILYFQDVGSTNGTLINGKEVEPYDLKQLSEGDIVQVGQSPITIEKISKITE